MSNVADASMPVYRIIGVVDTSSDPVYHEDGLPLSRKEYYFGSHIGENVVLEGVDTLIAEKLTDNGNKWRMIDYELPLELLTVMINTFERLDDDRYKGAQLALGKALAWLALPTETSHHARVKVICRVSPKRTGRGD